MNSPSLESELNKVLLKPRFKFEHQENKKVTLNKFKKEEDIRNDKFDVKVVNNHVIIDIKKEFSHIWSPQLQIEIEEKDMDTSLIKGLFGPKPQLWTFFIFIHFGVALTFAIFATMLYTDWSLGNNYTISLTLTILMPVLWVLFYFFGQLGKNKGRQQILDLNNLMNKVLKKHL